MFVFSYPNQVNERAARIAAGLTSAILLLALVSGASWLLPLLAVGFLARLAAGPRLSVLARATSFLASKLWPAKLVSGAPKRFAQGVGAACTLAATALFALGFPTAGWALSLTLLLFAGLEAAVGFCAGCWAYGYLQRWSLVPADACIDCAPAGARRR